jgi:sugar phosphate isomerase/epimerase
MTNARLSVNAMCTYSWPFERDLALWRDMGLAHAGLLIAKLGDDSEAKMQQLTDAGIRASTLITECFDLGDSSTWEKTRAVQRKAIDLVAEHKGHSIYFTPGRTTGAPWGEDLKRLGEAVAPTVAYGRERGVLAAIEPSLRTSVSFINTLRDAIDAAEATGLSLIADFGNMWMERDFRETLAKAMPHIALMQFGDIVIGSPGKAPPGGRAHIGEGELPLVRMMNDVLDAGYTGVFDLEVVPANFAADTDEAALRRGIEAASNLLDELKL